MRAVSGPSNASRLATAGGCVLAAAGLFLWLTLHTPANAQRFVLENQFADVTCAMEWWGGPERFSVRKGETYRRVYKTPKHGFVTVTCVSGARTIESPGALHLIDGGLAQLTLKPDGEFDLRYEGVS